MKLPNLEHAIVPEAKVTGCLLSHTHREGRHKAEFFVRFGFRAARWQELAVALLNHAREYDVVREESSPFGIRYLIEGALTAPDGRQPSVRTVWFIYTGEDIPRFVTAYPLKGPQT